MEKFNLQETAWQRAKRDTIAAQQTARFMWGGEGVLAVAGGAYFQALAPVGASAWEIVGRAVMGGLIGLFVAVSAIFLWNLFRAPYRQRDEARSLLLAKPKPIPLANRGELIRAISEVQRTSGVLLMAQGKLDDLKARNPNLVDTDVPNELQDEYNQAMSKLQAETIVAGKPFESILSELCIYIGTQVLQRVFKKAKPTIGEGNPQQYHAALKIYVRIIIKVTNALRKIDELSGQVPGKGDSQP